MGKKQSNPPPDISKKPKPPPAPPSKRYIREDVDFVKLLFWRNKKIVKQK